MGRALYAIRDYFHAAQSCRGRKLQQTLAGYSRKGHTALPHDLHATVVVVLGQGL